KLARFEDGDAVAGLLQLVAGGQPGQAAAQDDDVLRLTRQRQSAAFCSPRHLRRQCQRSEAQAKLLDEVAAIDLVRHSFSPPRISPNMLQRRHALCNATPPSA